MMICVFSDIHGNIDALNKMIEREMSVARIFIFAGDIFGYFYGQQEIINTFMSMPNLMAIKGNHEKYYLTGKEVECLTDKYGSSYKMLLTKEQRQYIENLPNKIEVCIEGRKFGIFHGGPTDYFEQRIYPDDRTEINKIVNEAHYDYLILGHTHYQLLCKKKRMVIINPGSLGQPRDGKGFSYCLLDTETGTCVYKSVDTKISELLVSVEKKDSDKYVCRYLKNKYMEEEKNCVKL